MRWLLSIVIAVKEMKLVRTEQNHNIVISHETSNQKTINTIKEDIEPMILFVPVFLYFNITPFCQFASPTYGKCTNINSITNRLIYRTRTRRWQIVETGIRKYISTYIYILTNQIKFTQIAKHWEYILMRIDYVFDYMYIQTVGHAAK